MSELWCGIVIAGGFTTGERKRWEGAREIRSAVDDERGPLGGISLSADERDRKRLVGAERVGKEDVQGERVRWGPVDGISKGTLKEWTIRTPHAGGSSSDMRIVQKVLGPMPYIGANLPAVNAEGEQRSDADERAPRVDIDSEASTSDAGRYARADPQGNDKRTQRAWSAASMIDAGEDDEGGHGGGVGGAVGSWARAGGDCGDVLDLRRNTYEAEEPVKVTNSRHGMLAAAPEGGVCERPALGRRRRAARTYPISTHRWRRGPSAVAQLARIGYGTLGG
ncbi:hypothetical protein DFH09DRAFT_1407120 [Mycena vulgaris]|nr:hypothetical protein DFH09DRAFT_1407120 [Mycena vulgaris]